MEMNKDEAEKCRGIGLRYINEGNYRQAIKFLDKSLRLYPLPGVEEMRNRAKRSAENTQHASTANGGNNANVRHRMPQKRDEKPTDMKRPYTADQLRIVQKIKSCKTHYEVLNVPKAANEADIKKAYRKLALRLHPDKNSAPGAEDAFKAVGKAFAILSDAEKRSLYDQYGDEATSVNQGRHQNRSYEEDISPEDIFNMFFGGGLRTPRRARAYPQRQEQQRDQARPAHAQFLQFIPLLLMFIISLLSIPSSPDAPFSMYPTGRYNVHRVATAMRDTDKISYYVDQSFRDKYANDPQQLMRVEQMVIQQYIDQLVGSCENQRLRQTRMIYRARNGPSYDRERSLRDAKEMRMPACEKLKQFHQYRY